MIRSSGKIIAVIAIFSLAVATFTFFLLSTRLVERLIALQVRRSVARNVRSGTNSSALIKFRELFPSGVRTGEEEEKKRKEIETID